MQLVKEDKLIAQENKQLCVCGGDKKRGVPVKNLSKLEYVNPENGSRYTPLYWVEVKENCCSKC